MVLFKSVFVFGFVYAQVYGQPFPAAQTGSQAGMLTDPTWGNQQQKPLWDPATHPNTAPWRQPSTGVNTGAVMDPLSTLSSQSSNPFAPTRTGFSTLGGTMLQFMALQQLFRGAGADAPDPPPTRPGQPPAATSATDPLSMFLKLQELQLRQNMQRQMPMPQTRQIPLIPSTRQMPMPETLQRPAMPPTRQMSMPETRPTSNNRNTNRRERRPRTKIRSGPPPPSFRKRWPKPAGSRPPMPGRRRESMPGDRRSAPAKQSQTNVPNNQGQSAEPAEIEGPPAGQSVVEPQVGSPRPGPSKPSTRTRPSSREFRPSFDQSGQTPQGQLSPQEQYRQPPQDKFSQGTPMQDPYGPMLQDQFSQVPQANIGQGSPMEGQLRPSPQRRLNDQYARWSQDPYNQQGQTPLDTQIPYTEGSPAGNSNVQGGRRRRPPMEGAMPPMEGAMPPMDGVMPPMDGAMHSPHRRLNDPYAQWRQGPHNRQGQTSLDAQLPYAEGAPAENANVRGGRRRFPPMEGGMLPTEGAMPPMEGVMPQMEGGMPPMEGTPAVPPMEGAPANFPGALMDAMQQRQRRIQGQGRAGAEPVSGSAADRKADQADIMSEYLDNLQSMTPAERAQQKASPSSPMRYADPGMGMSSGGFQSFDPNNQMGNQMGAP